MKNKSINKEYLKYMFVCSILFIIVSLFFVLYYFKVSIVVDKTASLYLDTISEKDTKNIKLKIENDIEFLTGISKHLSKKDDIFGEDAVDLIKNIFKNSQFERVVITKINGDTITADGYEINVYKERPENYQKFYKRTLIAKPYISNVEVSVIGDNNVIYVGVPVIKDDNIIAVLVGSYNVENISEIFNINVANDAVKSFIVKKNGIGVGSYFDDKFGLYFTCEEDLQESLNLNSKHIKQILNEIQNNESGFFSYYYNNQKNYIRYKFLEINDFYILTVTNENFINMYIKNANILMTIICFLLCVALLIIVAYIIAIKKFHYKTLTRLAYFDEIIEKENYEYFKEKMTNVIEKNKRYVFAAFDINRFKAINDVYGYEEGNYVLKYIANEVVKEICDGEYFARINQDTFIIAFNVDKDIREIKERILKFFERIKNYNSENIGSVYEISFSCGIYLYDKTKETVTECVDKAQIARKSIKGNYNTTIAEYDMAFQQKLIDSKEIEDGMNSAITNDEFEVYLQPKYELKHETVASAEALVRWNNPQKGFMSPAKFIPVFEKNGFIIKLDYYVFSKICKTIRTWIDAGKQTYTIAVNMSRIHIHEPEFVATLAKIAKEHDVPTNLIEIELTESAFCENTEKIVSVMNALKNEGFILSMDDFGTGYSSLNLLNQIPVDVLKLDRQFFYGTEKSEKGKRIIIHVINIARDLNIKVVAEGVETKEHIDFLKEINCDIVQGYYYAKPMPINKFEDIAFKE